MTTKTPPNIDLGKLEKILKEAAQLQREIDSCNRRHAQIGLGKFTLAYWPAIAATMLKLAEENGWLKDRLKKAVKSGFDMGKFVGMSPTREGAPSP